MKLLEHDYIENNCCFDTSYMREREKNKRWAHLGAGINPESSKREKNTASPSRSRAANQHGDELFYLETKESVCSDVTSSAAH